MNKKYIEWIIGILSAISYVISIYISVYKESKLIAILATILAFSALLIYLAALWYKERSARKVSEKETKTLKKVLQKKEDEIQKMRGITCQECKKIYAFGYPDDEWISLKEEPNKDERFSLIEELRDDYEERSVHHLDNQWIFISFWGEEKDYLIDLISKSIYLPIGKWEESKRDPLISYKILCSKRRENHFGFDEIDKLI